MKERMLERAAFAFVGHSRIEYHAHGNYGQNLHMSSHKPSQWQLSRGPNPLIMGTLWAQSYCIFLHVALDIL